MKKTVGLQDFISSFENCNRGFQFSREELEALFYALDDMEEGTYIRFGDKYFIIKNVNNPY